MNAPLPDAVREALERASLDDKYTLEDGRVFMSGVQALVRLPMLQLQRDAASGLDTAGFVSGYRGSPLGTYDQALWSARQHLESRGIVFQPGVNEELAATAVWGTQQLDLQPAARRHDGVFGIWYGKGPGVDRCVDVFKHANMAGTARHGGVLAVAGDDHIAKSSTAAHQSDHVFKACGMPVFFPTSVQDILDLGLHAFAMSRFAGVWTAMKTIQEIVESSSSIDLDADRTRIVLPDDFVTPPGGLHIRWPDTPLEQEARLMDHKWYAALAYVRANRLNHDVIAGPHDRFGIIASGKAWNDTRQALHDLGLDDATCRHLGIRLHKVNVVWPLEATITRRFAEGLSEILVVEEKRQMIEYQLKEELYNWRPDVRPNVLGKFDEAEGDLTGGEWSQPNPAGNWLLRAQADLSPAIIAKAIARRLHKLGMPPDVAARVDAHIAVLQAKERSLQESTTTTSPERPPWYCSGCPHNTSTKVPEGSRALAGIGCHYMSLWMDRRTSTFSQMGGEGVSWVGQAPFTTERHVFANLGDGTYFHSGLLAIRQSIAAGVNITYKILVNDAVAMTGGQPVEGSLGVPAMTRELEAEGVRRIVIASDEPNSYAAMPGLAPGVTVHHRDELDALQRELRETEGVSVIVYAQTCATEKRRRRKRGLMPAAKRRVVINELVCEGCGDCSVQSNCLAVEPVETDFGRKRRINQSSCNQDESCLKGFCPSFVTVEGQLRKPRPTARRDPAALPPLPEPRLPDCREPWGIVVAGIGGTGVITIGQLLGMAAHLEGKGVITQDAAGLAQKGGSTWSHVQIAERPEAIRTTKVDMAHADLVIACDPIVAAQRATLAVMREGRSFVALNTHGTPTAAFVTQRDWQFPAAGCDARLLAAVGEAGLGRLDADRLATRLLGDAIYTNPLLLGYAWQRGRVPLSHASLMRAIELNGVQVERNREAFEWGRRAAHDPAGLRAMVDTAQVIQLVRRPPLEALIEQRAEFLTNYQDPRWAGQYRAFVEHVRQAEAALNKATSGGSLAEASPSKSWPLTEAVARQLFRLMSYKDEYEVARLHTDAAFRRQLEEQFEGPVRLGWSLAPPMLPGQDAEGHPRKRHFGAWMGPLMGALARFRFLRGTAFDPFGHTAERRGERALIEGYRQDIQEVLTRLNADNRALAAEIARLPDAIRGYGHVKAKSMEGWRARRETLMQQWRATPVTRQAA